MSKKVIYPKEAGFTLLEMLVVLVIMGLLLSLAMPNFKTAMDKANQRADDVNRQLIVAQIDQYIFEQGKNPQSIDELVQKGYLRAKPTCPLNNGEYILSVDQSMTQTPQNRISCK